MVHEKERFQLHDAVSIGQDALHNHIICIGLSPIIAE